MIKVAFSHEAKACQTVSKASLPAKARASSGRALATSRFRNAEAFRKACQHHRLLFPQGRGDGLAQRFRRLATRCRHSSFSRLVSVYSHSNSASSVRDAPEKMIMRVPLSGRFPFRSAAFPPYALAMKEAPQRPGAGQPHQFEIMGDHKDAGPPAGQQIQRVGDAAHVAPVKAAGWARRG